MPAARDARPSRAASRRAPSSDRTRRGRWRDAQTHAAEGERAEHKAAAPSESHRELRLLGTDIEAVPFVVLAALVSVALAALGYARPRWLPGLVAIAVAMTLFGVVDVREAFHQSDENQTGLAILASVIAALHFAAAGLAVALAARRGNPESPGTAGTIPV